ncbi:MAG: PilN domain-containing protein [Candidatus Accumulibacter phosphatis]|uniref:PilN domain-containing protein n=2 Tax=Candidatus Accumulibacter TaxID=327159 RepID=A0A080MCN3_9PROT|nr:MULTISPECIES: PilN domain-containing protein [Candidatus Accumulibacter]KFB78225.1 MAG: putative periplasmic ligand-binding sensor domain protein [Candidatus Accumulibacter cognatus]MBL8400527.1 PilN domain-containing protein [Accumulibacter sp.]MBN8517923.1 PilN domain-containing protein [Accumulibacter sp.]MBO3712463.1 PilN domain-containing protein [Accumulibacter sp.]MCC2866509.1 PilN domain-containing protein [Candidatus Accumulibacter phosphatis]
MIRINLLPHREEKRRARRQQFYALLGLVTLLAGLIGVLVYSVIAGYISAQDARNDFLKKEIAVLNKEIDQIKRLKEQSDALMERKRIIESLQRDRAEAVRLLSELAKQMPEGVYLRSLKQEGQRISLGGYAQSSARVSTLMRNIEASPWLEKPQLLEIKAVLVDKRRLNEFTMNASIKRTTVGGGEQK